MKNAFIDQDQSLAENETITNAPPISDSNTPAPETESNPAPPKPPKPKTKRAPRSELRAFYRTLTIPELEERVEQAAQQLRDVIMDYIYATYKPDVPLPSLMQLRMHPPIARVAQDLDDVDQALKRAKDAERIANQPGLALIPPPPRIINTRPKPMPVQTPPITSVNTPVPVPRPVPAAVPKSDVPKKEKAKRKPKEKPPPTMVPDPNNPGQMIKRGRGRPRKHPIQPPPTAPAATSS